MAAELEKKIFNDYLILLWLSFTLFEFDFTIPYWEPY